MNTLITLTTDFGDSFASAQLHAVVAALGYDGKIIENHDVTDFSIVEGAFQISTLSVFCPDSTIHVGVVDPGVGGDRPGIIIRSRHYWFIGPDNGLLYPAASRDGITHVWKIQESKISDHVSSTFHGRDIFMKAAVYLAQGKQPHDFHSVFIKPTEIKPLRFQNGQILHIDHYGNIKVHWQKDIPVGQTLVVATDNQRITIPIVKTFCEVESGKPLALLGSSGTLELAINLGNAAAAYSVKTGDVLSIGKLHH